MKTLLILSAGIEAVPGIIKAKKLGIKTVVCDKDKNAPGFKYADYKIYSSIYKSNSLLTKVSKFNQDVRKINGVIAIAADASIMVSKLLKKLNIKGISINTAKLCTDKLLMKMKLKSCGINIPWFSEIKNLSQLKKILYKDKTKYIIKPVDNRGSRGVLQIDYKSDISWCYKYCLGKSNQKKIIIEKYLKGKQISSESIINNHESFTPGIIERNYEFLNKYKPFIIENGGQQPANLTEKEKELIIQVTVKAGKCLGIKTGTIKGDIVLVKGKPYIIEIASRLSGGWMSSDQIKMSTGIDFLKLAIKLSLGDKINFKNLKIRKQNAVAIRYLFAKPKSFFSLNEKNLKKKTKYIKKFKLYLKDNDYVDEITDHTKRAGFAISIADNKQKAIFEANKFLNSLIKK